MTRRVAVRAVLLAAAAAGVLVALTAYFSSEKIPPCLVSGAPKWKPPRDRGEHRFLVVVPDRALCFYSIDDGHRLVGAVPLPGIKGVTAVMPGPRRIFVRHDGDQGALVDLRTGAVRRGVRPPPAPRQQLVVLGSTSSGVAYSTEPGVFGVRVFNPVTRRPPPRLVTFRGFTWNPRFGPDPPNHGLSYSPDRPELWVLDAPNSVLHVLRPRGRSLQRIADVRLSKPLSGDERPCVRERCRRLGSLMHSADGRYVYVGDAGDVFDGRTRRRLVNLEALHQSRVMFEADWIEGRVHVTMPGGS